MFFRQEGESLRTGERREAFQNEGRGKGKRGEKREDRMLRACVLFKDRVPILFACMQEDRRFVSVLLFSREKKKVRTR